MLDVILYSRFFHLIFILVPSALAHGFVQTVVLNGQALSGWNPFVDPYASPVPVRVIRKIPSDGPITDISDPDLACNTGGEQGTGMIADVPGGSSVDFEWTNWPSDHLGPVSTYMTSCGSNCTTFDVTGAEWFKVDAEGYDNGQWASARLIANNNTWTSTVPSALKPGQYLMRHEIVALHVTGEPQYYMSCTQVQVNGDGTSLPSSQETVKIPGLYDNVQFPDIWTGNFTSFPAPGPPVAALTGDTGSPSSSNQTDSSGSSSSAASNSTSSASPASSTQSGGKCRLVAQSTVGSSQRRALVRRRSH